MPDVRDPRSFITPDAFAVAPELLGLPLARPSRRATAMLIDLALVGILIKAISFTMFVIAAALLLFRVARPSPKAGALRRGVAWTLRAWAIVLIAVFGLLLVDKVRDFVRDARTAVAASERDTVAVEQELNPLPGNGDAATEPSDEADAPLAAQIRAYVDALERGDTAGVQQHRTAAERAIAGDRIDQLESDRDSLRARVSSLETDLKRERERGGVRDFLAGLGDDLGIGFGWTAVYFTAFVVLWNGQTPGKRLLGIRVIRLDGKPLSWWVAFERFGGYAASLSTGMLGFLQILWDRNRQGMHDKFISTVVIRETTARAAAVPQPARYEPPLQASAPPGSRPPV